MIRSPASRILPGPEEINYHLERVLMRLAARHQVYSPADSEDDGDSSDEPSIDSTDVSSPSPGSSSGYESAGLGSGSDQYQEDQDRDEDGDGDKEPEGESCSSSTGSCIIHRETDHYTWRCLSLLPPHTFTPSESWSADMEALTLSPGEPTRSLPLHSQVSSLRLLFETLSLDSLPSHNPVFDQKLFPVSRPGSENQRPIQSKSPFESELDIDLSMGKNTASRASGTKKKTPGPVKKTRATRSDIAMEDEPALASPPMSNAESSDTHQPVPNRSETTRTSGSTAQRPVPARKPRKIRKTTAEQAGQTTQTTGRATRQTTRKSTRQATQTHGQTTGPATKTTSSTHVPDSSDQSTNAAVNPQGTAATTTKVTEAMTTGLTPEKRAHMMDSSHIFHAHVQQMIAELEDEYEDDDKFGMRELRRRPAGSGRGRGRGLVEQMVD